MLPQAHCHKCGHPGHSPQRPPSGGKGLTPFRAVCSIGDTPSRPVPALAISVPSAVLPPRHGAPHLWTKPPSLSAPSLLLTAHFHVLLSLSWALTPGTGRRTSLRSPWLLTWVPASVARGGGLPTRSEVKGGFGFVVHSPTVADWSFYRRQSARHSNVELRGKFLYTQFPFPGSSPRGPATFS